LPSSFFAPDITIDLLLHYLLFSFSLSPSFFLTLSLTHFSFPPPHSLLGTFVQQSLILTNDRSGAADAYIAALINGVNVQSPGSIVFRLCNSRSIQERCVDYTSLNSIIDGSWHWVVLVRSSSFAVSLYVDCTLQNNPDTDGRVTGALDSGNAFLVGHLSNDQHSFALAYFVFADASSQTLLSYSLLNATAFALGTVVDTSGHGRNGVVVGSNYDAILPPTPSASCNGECVREREG
jgi:hypothetical protein